MKIPYAVLISLVGLSVMTAQTKSQPPVNSAASSQAQRWEGKLVDAGRTDCGVEVVGAAPRGMCPVSVTTVSFGLLMADGKMAKFDEGGNPKAMDALKKSKKASKLVMEFWKSGKSSHQVVAIVAGTLTGDTLNVESIKIN
jgi:hypothetical protein